MKIKVTRNGPYIVKGSIPLSEKKICLDPTGQFMVWKDGIDFRVDDTYELCRCGRSGKKPFCDGNHVVNEFDGTESATNAPYLEQAIEYNGSSLKLTDVEPLCALAHFCLRGDGVWNLTLNSSVPEDRQLAIEEAGDCPAGRLVVWDTDGNVIEPSFDKSIAVIEDIPANTDGPLWVRGGIPVESADGNTYEIRNRVTLCRCGRSMNKPFCDGSHLD